MTTDITELAQSLKAAAEKANPGPWRRASTLFNGIARGKFSLTKEDIIAGTNEKRDAEFIALANPANILALVEALEKAQETIAFQQGEIKALLSSLESRTVTVKQDEVLVTVAGFTGCGKSAIAGEIEIAMKAIGVPVTWVNGDAEKRMTGADWLTAIEMYKPTVRIVEENIPRAAGIKWEAE
ncbi:ead/Ea22-like family protein [Klebsiella aerogenes]|uniref:ead/Ea22-like family protein n=1 Tax=Klebsiella aerogenes TaxID=548 RepID=UPI000BFBF6E7|nr:ead/Ea22-like family protein [Klebsiella aerogenes]ATM92204.1 hypothetical protein CRN78_17400 [Klebsiella aerogenes]ELA1892130.1 ead/Ea22-like family protein [Klebsiella aerogenes]